MRTAASNFFSLGADGFYIFNWYGVPDGSDKAACLKQCGSPAALAGLDKRHVADSGCRIRYCGYTNPPSQFPSPLVGGRDIELVVGDDVAEAQREGTLGRMVLRMAVSHLGSAPTLLDLVNRVPPKEGVCVQINGVQLPPDAIGRDVGAAPGTELWPADIAERERGDTLAVVVTAPPVRRGINTIRVLPGPGNQGSLRTAVVAMDLVVDYKPVAEVHAARGEVRAQGPPAGQRVVEPVSGVPLSLYEVPVGSKKAIAFDVDIDPKVVKKAQLGLRADDFDSRKEVTITLNGGSPLTIPDALIADMGFRTGFVDVPVSQLRPGKNVVLFTFASNLNGTTQGFDVAEALLVLRTE